MQSVAYTSTAGVIANPIPKGCNVIHVKVTSDAHVRISNNPVATDSDIPLTANVDYEFTCSGGDKVSALQMSAAGILYVTPLTQ